MKKILIAVFIIIFLFLSGCQQEQFDSNISASSGSLQDSERTDTFEAEDGDTYYLPLPEESEGWYDPFVEFETLDQFYNYYQTDQIKHNARRFRKTERGVPILHPDKLVRFVFPEFVEDVMYSLVRKDKMRTVWLGESYSYTTCYGYGWFDAQIHTKYSFDKKYEKLSKGSDVSRIKDIIAENRFVDEASQTEILTLEFSQGDGEVVFFYELPDEGRTIRVIEICDWDPKSEDYNELSELMLLKGDSFEEQHVFYAYETENYMILSLKMRTILSQHLLEVDIAPFE